MKLVGLITLSNCIRCSRIGSQI